ncbi:MAG TPA: LON peptidase substrate-binding domain-containing protein [Rhodanobacteraceae bacterium]|nr:LON peptidase substrate-binding domain-containing protein [Rhodanobacteraceae bacterium]
MASASQAILDLPLFPLADVLFPGGALQLRIFEPRYLDMVRECAREGRGFGVCLILEGHEAGAPPVSAAVGTLARITDFFNTGDGLLGIAAEGGERFRVVQARVRDNGLIRGDLECWPAEPEVAVPAELGLLPTILERLVEQVQPPWRNVSRTLYDDACWVGFRLAELLPLDGAERQYLLEMTDPLLRLHALRDILPRFQRG